MIVSGSPITQSKPMLEGSWATPPIGMASGFSGFGYQNGEASTVSGRRILFECDNSSVDSSLPWQQFKTTLHYKGDGGMYVCVYIETRN